MKKENLRSMLDVERETDCQNDRFEDQSYGGCRAGGGNGGVGTAHVKEGRTLDIHREEIN